VVNYAKSTLYPGSIAAPRLQQLSTMLNFNIGTFPFNYLGVPVFKGKSKVSHLRLVADKIKAKLLAWKVSLLSMTGRIQLAYVPDQRC